MCLPQSGNSEAIQGPAPPTPCPHPLPLSFLSLSPKPGVGMGVALPATSVLRDPESRGPGEFTSKTSARSQTWVSQPSDPGPPPRPPFLSLPRLPCPSHSTAGCPAPSVTHGALLHAGLSSVKWGRHPAQHALLDSQESSLDAFLLFQFGPRPPSPEPQPPRQPTPGKGVGKGGRGGAGQSAAVEHSRSPNPLQVAAGG